MFMRSADPHDEEPVDERPNSTGAERQQLQDPWQRLPQVKPINSERAEEQGQEQRRLAVLLPGLIGHLELEPSILRQRVHVLKRCKLCAVRHGECPS
jgi:hypothetical protein